MAGGYHSVTAYLSKLQPINVIIDITLLVATEFLTRCIYSSGLRKTVDFSTKQIHLFTVQSAMLTLSGLILYTFHHTPYLLAFITIFILVRLLVVVLNRKSSDSLYPGSYVSETIRRPNWPASSGVVQPRSEYNYPTSMHHLYRSGLSSVGNQNAYIGKPSPPPMPNKSLTNSSLNQTQKKSVPHTRESITVRESASLQRSPLSASMAPPPSNPQAGDTSSISSGGRSFIGHSLGYVSSLFSNKQLSSTTPSGMYNLGNTCFINSTLQCLIWTSGFIDSLPYMYASQVYNDSTRLVRVLDDVVNLCHAFPDSGGECRPVDVTQLLQSISLVAPHLVVMPDTDAYQSQQDAAEFLLWLLNHLHGILRVQSGGKSGLEFVLSESNISDLKKSKTMCLSILQRSKSTEISLLREPLMNLSEVDWQLHWQEDSSSLYQLFLGQLIEARECQRCGKMSFSIEYFTVLPLPLPMIMAINQHCTLQDCFELFSITEDMTQSNMITCSCMDGSEASLTPGKRLTLLSRPSKRLVVQLTRYSYDSVQRMAVKNSVSILFPTALNLYPHTMSSVINSNLHTQSMAYELQGFCVHSGAQSTSHGHYVAYCKTSLGQWYYFNDEQVSVVDNIEAELTSPFVLQNAYLLFYSFKDIN